MQRVFAATSIFSILAAGSVTDAQAATFNVNGSVDSLVCVNETSSVGVSGGCDVSTSNGSATLDGRSDLGSMGIAGNIGATGTNPGGVELGPRATINANYFDVLSFGIQSGTFILPVDVAGSNSVVGTGMFGGIVGGGAGVSSTVGVVVGITNVYQETLVFDGLDYYTFDVIGTLGVSNVFFEIVDGKVDLVANFTAALNCQGLFAGATCNANANFFTSARFLGATVLDELGSVSDTLITSQSGFDYRAGVAPHVIPPIPLPAGFWFLGSALLIMGGSAARARTKRLKPRSGPALT